MKKQDRQGVRTPADIERKYNLGEVKKTFQGVRNGNYLSTENLEKLDAQIRADFQAILNNYARNDTLSNYATTDALNDAITEALTEADRNADSIATQAVAPAFSSIDKLNKQVNGSWITLTLGDGFIARGNSDNLKPVYKVSGCVVTVCGIVSNSAAMTVPSAGVVIASGIEEEHRPHMDQHFVCQTANMDLWRCAVKTDGTVTLARLGNTTARDLGANTWLPFSVTYQI